MNSNPIRVIHIIVGKNIGGVEKYLTQVIRKLNKERFQLDIIFIIKEKTAYYEEFKKLGSRVYHCPDIYCPWKFAKKFYKIVKENGPYDIIHSHLYRYSGFVLRLAAIAGIPIRIAHSHSTKPIKPWLICYDILMKKWLKAYATYFFSVSNDAANALLGSQNLNDTRLHIIPPGIDLTPFRVKSAPYELRRKLNIPKHSKIVGHVGRFVEAKNHLFILKVAFHLIRKSREIKFLLIGDGPLLKKVKNYAKKMGIEKNIYFLGERKDVPRLMIEAMDVFIFPSKWEGLAMALIEAQAAGLPCIISDVIPHEVEVVKNLIHRLSLLNSAEVWAEKIWDLLHKTPNDTRENALYTIEQSIYNIENSLNKLENIYISSLIKNFGNLSNY